ESTGLRAWYESGRDGGRAGQRRGHWRSGYGVRLPNSEVRVCLPLLHEVRTFECFRISLTVLKQQQIWRVTSSTNFRKKFERIFRAYLESLTMIECPSHN